MELLEQAKYIDLFLKTLYNSSFAMSLAMGIEMKQIPSERNKQKFKTLEYILEELDLVDLVRGRDNSTLGGQCEYFISAKGKALVENNESSIALLLQQEMKKNGLAIYGEQEWDKYYDRLLEKRADQADFFLDMIIEKRLINLDKVALRKYFKQWFQETQEFDLQIKNGDLALEDGDLQTVPDFNEDNIPEFLKWFETKGNIFLDFLEVHGVKVKTESKKEIINYGNLIINKNSKIENQTIGSDKGRKESNWSKTNVIVALVVGVATIVGIIWGILK